MSGVGENYATERVTTSVGELMERRIARWVTWHLGGRIGEGGNDMGGFSLARTSRWKKPELLWKLCRDGGCDGAKDRSARGAGGRLSLGMIGTGRERRGGSVEKERGGANGASGRDITQNFGAAGLKEVLQRKRGPPGKEKEKPCQLGEGGRWGSMCTGSAKGWVGFLPDEGGSEHRGSLSNL